MFCIGGPFGHSQAVRARGNETIRLSKMVLNHQVNSSLIVWLTLPPLPPPSSLPPLLPAYCRCWLLLLPLASWLLLLKPVLKAVSACADSQAAALHC